MPQTYLTQPSPQAKAYPVNKIEARRKVANASMDSDLLWQMQQTVFNTKMDILQKIIAEGFVPAGEAFVEIDVRVAQRAIDAEATDGQWITLPVNMHHFVTYSNEFSFREQ